jgi:transketolase
MTINSLAKQAKEIRCLLLAMHAQARTSHVGTSLSEIDILTFLYGSYLQPDDTFILSKGHGASGLYATLRYFNRLNDEVLQTYARDGTKLSPHPPANYLKDIPLATGSLGHGFPVAAGMAYADRLDLFETTGSSSRKVVCLLSDGECNEGSTWEAALFAAHHKLSQLTVVVDYNDLQGFGRTSEVLNLEPFAEKWKAFGFAVETIDGHDFHQLKKAFETKTDNSGRPKCILARTIKGKGVSFMEDKLEWHYLSMSQEIFEKALAELEQS